MQTIDTLIRARWLIPVEPHNTVFEDYSVAIDEGCIIALGPHHDLVKQFQPEQLIELNDHALIPGLVNAHTHSAMSLMRGLADDLPLMTWLQDHIWPAEQRWVSDDFAHDGSQFAIAEMLRSGTTCFNDMYFFADDTARVASTIGMRATVGLILIDFPTAYAADPEEYLRKGLALHDQYRNDPLIHTAFAPHAPYTVSDGPLEKLRVLSDEMDIPIHMHIHETRFEVEDAFRQQGKRPLQRLDELGLLSPAMIAVHMTQLSDAEIQLVADRGCHVVHCPESNLKLASGFCPVQRLIDAGVNVALGTDGAASNNDLDMFGEMRTAALLGKAVAEDAAALSAANTLRMATLNGARALGLGDEIGSIEPGKWADLCAVNLVELETQPLYHPISQLVYACARNQVSDVWVAGRHLLKDRVLTTLDNEELMAQAQSWQRKLAHSDPDGAMP